MIPPPYLIPLKHPEKAEPAQPEKRGVCEIDKCYISNIKKHQASKIHPLPRIIQGFAQHPKREAQILFCHLSPSLFPYCSHTLAISTEELRRRLGGG